MKLMNGSSRIALSVVAGSVALGLTGCGGGGGSPTPSPAPPSSNSAPNFTSSATGNFVENGSGTVYTATASDADGDGLSYSIAGGADAAAFSITGARLSFNSVPDFEKPMDTLRDNTYEVTLSVQDGRGGSDTLNLIISITNDREGIAVTRVGTFAGARAVDFAGTGELFVYLRDGRVLTINDESGATIGESPMFRTAGVELITGVKQVTRSGAVRGSFAVGRKADGALVLSNTRKGDIFAYGEDEITPPSTQVPAVSLVELGDSWDLQIAIGETQPGQASDPNSRFGKLHDLAADPFCGAGAGVCLGSLVIGNGIRHPGGMGIIGNSVVLADQGESREHEISFYPSNARPLDFGWSDREGTQEIVSNARPAVIGPTLVYEFGDNPFQGRGIVIGGTYTGPVAELADRYIFGDVNGSIFSIPISVLTDGFLHRSNDLELRTADFEPDAGDIASPLDFLSTPEGKFYILDSDGELFRVEVG